MSLGYNFNGGRHLNRPINANAPRGDLLVRNWQAAYSDPSSYATVGGPLGVGLGPSSQGFLPCNINPNNGQPWVDIAGQDRKSTRLNSSHSQISYAVFCLKKKNKDSTNNYHTAKPVS